MINFEFDQPDRFTAGAIGEVGNRLFVLQCRQDRRLLTVKVEKGQVSALATYLAQIVKEMGRPAHLPDDLELESDLEIDFSVAELSVALDETTNKIVLTLTAISDAEGGGDAAATISLTREQAGAFAIVATRLVESGRPPCPLCALPLDPRGHDCPRTNGFRAPIT